MGYLTNLRGRKVSGTARRAGLVLLLAAAVVAPVRGAPFPDSADAPIDPAIILKFLAARKQQQINEASGQRAFHDFRFTDGLARTGIDFTTQVVDDVGKHNKPIHYDHGTGMAAADVDGDGRSDLYFVSQVGGNQLWRNLGNGRFENITGPAGVGLRERICVSASFADIDNDGDPDLFVTTVKMGNVLFENLGGGRFRDITREAALDYTGHSSGSIFFDFNNDGLLDLFVANVGRYTTDRRGAGGYYIGITNAFSGHLDPALSEPSLLYQNLGARKFKQVSPAVLQHIAWTGDASFCDLNQDGFPDLYTLNMQGDDHYYENVRGERFVEGTSRYFPKTPWGSMGLKFFDYNNDGLIDLFVTDMHSDMTRLQIDLQKNFSRPIEKSKSEAYCSKEWTEEYLQGSSNNIFGNAFYQNLGGGRFAEVSQALNAETFWPWGISVADLNADGYEDVFVASGMGYPFGYAVNSVLLNERGRRFIDSEFVLGIEPRPDGRVTKVYFILDCSGPDKDHPYCQNETGRIGIQGTLSSRSSVAFDIDEDGDLDLVTNEINDRPLVLLSTLSDRKPIHYLKIKLTGNRSNREGLGATVKVFAGTNVWTRFHDGKSGYLSQSSLPLYFGLDEARRADRIEVQWPSGQRQSVTNNIPVNGGLTIVERGQ